MPEIQRATVDEQCFNPDLSWLPYNLQKRDFISTMNEVYDFMYELNLKATDTGWQRLEDMLPAQSLSGMMSAMLKVSLAKFSRSLVSNAIENGFPDLIPRGVYEGNRIQDGSEGVEIKSTNKSGGAVDMHSAHDGWLCVFVYEIDVNTERQIELRRPFQFSEIYCGRVFSEDYRLNGRGLRGTRTATLDANGLKYFRKYWVYASKPARNRQWFKTIGQHKPETKRMPTRAVDYGEEWYRGPGNK